MCAAKRGGWVNTLQPPSRERWRGNGWEAVVCERVGGLQQLLGGMRRALHAHRHRSVCPSRPQKDRHATAGTAATLHPARTNGWCACSPRCDTTAQRFSTGGLTRTRLPLAGKGAVHAPPGHPQSSRYTARCPSIVLCTPCIGVEWPRQGLGERHVAQEACEPGRGGYGGPAHPTRLHTPYVPAQSA